MEPYDVMYKLMVAAAADAVEVLQHAIQRAEDIYINASPSGYEGRANESAEETTPKE